MQYPIKTIVYPAIGVRDPGLFNFALARPANLYHCDNCADLTMLAATCASNIIQNRSFVDGNARTGFIAAYLFLDLNGLTLEADEISATTMTLALAASEIDETEHAEWIDKHTRSTVAWLSGITQRLCYAQGVCWQ